MNPYISNFLNMLVKGTRLSEISVRGSRIERCDCLGFSSDLIGCWFFDKCHPSHSLCPPHPDSVEETVEKVDEKIAEETVEEPEEETVKEAGEEIVEKTEEEIVQEAGEKIVKEAVMEPLGY